MTVRTVYLLCNENLDLGRDVYVGSTSQTLSQRLCEHKRHAKQQRRANYKLYKRMREVGLENWIIRPLLSLESTMCSRDDIRKFEKMWCEIFNVDLNTLSPITSAEERREREVLRYKENRDVILRKKAIRYETNRDSERFFCELCEKSFSANQT